MTTETTRICPVDEEPFTPSRSDQVYCSDACKQKAYRLRETEPSALERLRRELLVAVERYQLDHDVAASVALPLVVSAQPERWAPLRLAVEARRER